MIFNSDIRKKLEELNKTVNHLRLEFGEAGHKMAYLEDTLFVIKKNMPQKEVVQFPQKDECSRYYIDGYVEATICLTGESYMRFFPNKGQDAFKIRINFCPWCGKPAQKQQHLIETEGK